MSGPATLIPLGRVEDHKLELKDKDVLERPVKVAREAVAMLNAGGGEIWIGIREQDGFAVEIQPIDQADAAARRLHDHLVDAIEPSPIHDELRVDPIDQSGMKILRVRLDEPDKSRLPFAVLEGGRRSYVSRVGARLRPMSREEIASRFRDADPHETSSSSAVERLDAARKELLDQATPTLWLHLEPSRDFDLDLGSSALEVILTQPSASDTPAHSFHILDPYHRPRLRTGYIVSGNNWIRVETTGALDLRIPARELSVAVGASELNAFQLLSYSISFLRVARALYRDRPLSGQEEALADIALTGAERLALRSSAWKRIGQAERFTFADGADLVPPRPMRFSMRGILDETDRCALRLVAQVFEGYGIRRSEMPRVDWDRGALLLDE